MRKATFRRSNVPSTREEKDQDILWRVRELWLAAKEAGDFVVRVTTQDLGYVLDAAEEGEVVGERRHQEFLDLMKAVGVDIAKNR